MKKTIFAIALAIGAILVVGAVGATNWAGMRIETEYLRAIASVPPNAFCRVKADGFERGVLSSTARTAVEILIPAGSGETTEAVVFLLVHRISHGPLPAANDGMPALAVVETTLAPSQASSEQVKGFFRDYPELLSLRDRTVVPFGGGGRSRLEIPAFRGGVGADRVTVDWKGLVATTAFEPGWARISGTLRMPGLEVFDEEGALKLTDIEANLDSKKGIAGFYFGRSAFSVGTISFDLKREGTEEEFVLSNFRAQTDANESGGLIASECSMQAEKVRIASTALSAVGLDLKARNLEAAFIGQLKEELESIQAAGARIAPERGEHLRQLALQGLPSFLAKGPEIEISRLEAASSEGRLSGRIRFGIEKTAAPIEDPQNFLRALAAQAEISADEALVRQVAITVLGPKLGQGDGAPNPEEARAMAEGVLESGLAPLIEQGLLRKENGVYKTSALFLRGQLTVNGKPVPLPIGL